MEPEILHIVLLIMVGFGAGFVQRVSGFGLGIFSMLFLPHFMSTHTAAATISCLFSCGTSTYNAVKYRRNIPFKVILPLIIAAMITIPVAVYFSVMVSGEIFEIILGIVLIILSIYFLLFDSKVSVKPNLKNSLLAGSIGGVLNGLFSTGGPPIVLYLTHALSDNMLYFAGIQFYFAVTNIYATAMRVASGVVNIPLVLYALIGFAGCMAGDFLGKKVFNRLDSKKLKTVIYIGMILSGILMIFN